MVLVGICVVRAVVNVCVPPECGIGLTSATKLVNNRREDLTNASHACILEEETEQVRNLSQLDNHLLSQAQDSL